MPEKHELENKAGELLDRVLACYAGEPLAGLETRTLSRLRLEQEAAAARFSKRSRWMRWLAATTAGSAAVAASLLIGIQIGQHRSDLVWQQRVANASGVWNSVKPAGVVNVPPAPSATTASAPRKHLRRTAGPKLTKNAQFPTPVPMTAQERSLARLAATADPAVLASLAQWMQAPLNNDAAQNEQAGPPQ